MDIVVREPRGSEAESFEDPDVDSDEPYILNLPDAAIAVIWACLDPNDKKSLFTASRGLRSALSAHAHAISIRTPTDEELEGGYDALPDTLLSLPLHTLHGLRLRATRRYYNKFHQNRSRMSGEDEPRSERALHALMAAQAHVPPSCHAHGTDLREGQGQGGEMSAAPSILAATHTLELQGYFLSEGVAESLGSAGHASLVRLELTSVDLSGPFFTSLSWLSACKALRLERVQLVGREAEQSLQDLARLPSLSSLSLIGIKASDGPSSTAHQHHPDLSFLSTLTNLTSFELRCFLADAEVPPGHCAQLIQWAAAGCPSLEVLQLWGMGEIETLGAAECGVLARGCPQLHTLSFDQYVVIEGVPQLMELQHLTSLTARSLEPESADAPWLSAATWGSLQKLGLGAFYPSLTSLQCLPLGSLTHSYPLSRFDLSPLRNEQPDKMGEAVAAAVSNVLRCPVLELPSGKLEIIGSQTHSSGVMMGGVVVGGLQQRPLPAAAPALLELRPLQASGLLTQLRLTGLVVGMAEVDALAFSVGPSLATLILTGCHTDPVALARLAHDERFERLSTIAFGRGCQGVGLQEVEEAVCIPFPRPLLLRVVRPLGPDRHPSEGLVATAQDIQAVRERLQSWGRWDVRLEVVAHIL